MERCEHLFCVSDIDEVDYEEHITYECCYCGEIYVEVVYLD